MFLVRSGRGNLSVARMGVKKHGFTNSRRLRLLKSHRSVLRYGPPCETWSAARHIQPDAPGHWPRPLRSAKMPWGLPDLSCKELRQLGMGTRLYLHSTVAEFYVYSGGGSTLKEHPKGPKIVTKFPLGTCM